MNKYRNDTINGAYGKKPILNILNKKKVHSYDMDIVFGGIEIDYEEEDML